MAFKSKNKPGITLVEILIVMGVTAFIIAMIGSVYIANYRLFSNQNSAMDVSIQNHVALNEVTNQIRQSAGIVSTCPSCGADTTSATLLILQLWPIDATGEPFDPGASNFDYIIYKRDPNDDTKLKRYTYPFGSSSRQGGAHQIASNISDLQFSFDNADPAQAKEITITVSASANSGTKIVTATDTEKATLRNK